MRRVIDYLFNPGRYLRFARYAEPCFSFGTVGFFALGLYYALWGSPPDYQQGETVRIMYVHVPAAWLGLLIYVSMAVASALGLVMRLAMADLFCVAAAPVGAALVALCLITGSLWGEPTWGTWWVWDARLTSVLILFLLYCGFLLLRHGFDDHEKGAKAGAVLLLIGAVNIPIVRFSVDWWHTLHQPASLLKASGSAIDPSMLKPLLLMGAAYLFYACLMISIRLRSVILTRRLDAALLRDSPDV